MRWIMLCPAGWIFVLSVAGAADRAGNGVEADVNLQSPAETPLPATADAKTEPVVRVVKVPPGPVKAEPALVPVAPTPEPETGSLKQAAPLVAPRAPDVAASPLKVAPIEPEAILPLATMSGPGDTPASAQTEPEDVAADLPGSVSAQRVSPFHVVMEDFSVEGNPGAKAQKTLRSVVELKKLIGLVAHDLDAGGVERTRLLFNTESIAREASMLAETWSDVPPMVSSCVNAKRTSLVLVEELHNEPRQWSHVRWAFQDCQKQVKQLRQVAARMAGSEPQLVRVEKKGKVYFVEATNQDPAQLKLEEEERKRQALKDERDLNRERAKEIKNTMERVPVNYEK